MKIKQKTKILLIILAAYFILFLPQTAIALARRATIFDFKKIVDESEYILIGRGVQERQVNKKIDYGGLTINMVCSFGVIEVIKGDSIDEVEFYLRRGKGGKMAWSAEDTPSACVKTEGKYNREVVFLKRHENELVLESSYNYSEPDPNSKYYEFALKSDKIVSKQITRIKNYVNGYYHRLGISGLLVSILGIVIFIKKRKIKKHSVDKNLT